MPFPQRVEYKVPFVCDQVDGVINQFVDIENKIFFEKSRKHIWIATSAKDLPPISYFLAAR